MIGSVVLSLAASASAAKLAATFVPPAPAPTSTASTVYEGKSNNTLTNSPVVKGKVFDRFIQIWLENTDFDAAATTAAFQELAEQGLLLDNFYALTHPSEPNYIASMSGDFYGLGDDDFYAIPSNISTLVDLLEAKNVSWASYQENAPYDGYTGNVYEEENYLQKSDKTYEYYKRKHNPPIIHNAVANQTDRALRVRNYNDFANDVNANALSQWIFFTPNMVNDGHDTQIQFVDDYLRFWLYPLLNNTNFNTDRTIILLTFDENENYGINNQVYTLVLGNGLPSQLKNTTDSIYYTHYSSLSTVEANWGLGSLGRGDTNKTLANVFQFVADVTGYENVNVSEAEKPFTNRTGDIPGALNAAYYVPFTAPNISAVGAGGGEVFIRDGLNTSFTLDVAPAPVNLTALGQTPPANTNPNISYATGEKVIGTGADSTTSATDGNGAASLPVGGAAVVAVLAVAGCAFLL